MASLERPPSCCWDPQRSAKIRGILELGIFWALRSPTSNVLESIWISCYKKKAPQRLESPTHWCFTNVFLKQWQASMVHSPIRLSCGFRGDRPISPPTKWRCKYIGCEYAMCMLRIEQYFKIWNRKESETEPCNTCYLYVEDFSAMLHQTIQAKTAIVVLWLGTTSNVQCDSECMCMWTLCGHLWACPGVGLYMSVQFFAIPLINMHVLQKLSWQSIFRYPINVHKFFCFKVLTSSHHLQKDLWKAHQLGSNIDHDWPSPGPVWEPWAQKNAMRSSPSGL